MSSRLIIYLFNKIINITIAKYTVFSFSLSVSKFENDVDKKHSVIIEEDGWAKK